MALAKSKLSSEPQVASGAAVQAPAGRQKADQCMNQPCAHGLFLVLRLAAFFIKCGAKATGDDNGDG
jgi:hypothetical protein